MRPYSRFVIHLFSRVWFYICSQVFIDIQDRVSYTYPHKKVLIINISEKAIDILCRCREDVNYIGKGNHCMIGRTPNEI
jgi:hypothetical protein